MRASSAAIWLAAAVSSLFAPASTSMAESFAGLLGLPQSLESAFAPRVHPSAIQGSADRPHPAVARIVVPEGDGATSYGSGTLVDVRNQFGLVVTNWHVVRDGTGEVEVVFPDGFRSKARPLKVDADWDLAALVIWRPPVQPVRLAAAAPQPGDQLTICGYGSGQYRAATGRCTQYYAPAVNLPQHMVELDVEARQGDSGGPIFNDRGELAGVLFGAGRGTTLGSFGGRVGSFLGTLAPDIGRPAENLLAQSHITAPIVDADAFDRATGVGASATVVPREPTSLENAPLTGPQDVLHTLAGDRNAANGHEWQSVTAGSLDTKSALPRASSSSLFAHAKNVLAVVGVLAIMLTVLRVVR